MRSTSFDNSRHPLRSILAIGFGSSLLLHLGLILGVAHWWQPAVTNEESIEITLVEPVEIAPVKSAPPPIAIGSKPVINQPSQPVIPTPIPTAIVPTILNRSSAPKIVKSPSKPIVIKPIGVKPSNSPQPLAPKIATPKLPKPGSPLTKPTTPPNRIPVIKANPPFPSDFGAATRDDRSASPPPKSFSLPIAPQPQPKTKTTPIPVNSPIPTRSNESEQASAPKPLPANPLTTPTPLTSAPIQPTPTTPATPNPTPTRSNPPPRSASNLQPPQDPPKSIVRMTGSATENPLTGSNNDRQAKPIGNPADGGLVPNQAGTKPVNGGAVSSPNTDDRSGTNNGVPTGNPGAVNGTSTNEGKTSNNPRTGSAGKSGLQCIKNCQIAKLQDLQDSDGGKDRLRIRVTIDANGIVTAAEIAKSSGNPQIDKTILEGIEQMQFQPSGKPIKGIIRANIFL